MSKIINKKAYHEYQIIEEITAGIKLIGSEVKSLRLGNANLTDSYCTVWNNEIFIKNLFISKYHEASYLNHDEKAVRKLLLRKKEINNLMKKNKETGITVIPLEIFIIRGRFKVKIAICKGKKLWNKREDIKKRDIDREVRRELSDR